MLQLAGNRGAACCAPTILGAAERFQSTARIGCATPLPSFCKRCW